jgi:WD40 repeat protein/serine/threonine protein kinase
MNPDRLDMTEDALNHPGDDALRALSVGRLADAELAVVSAHLGECPACRRRIDELAIDDRLIARLQRDAVSGKQLLVSRAQRRSAVRALRLSNGTRSAAHERGPEPPPAIPAAPRQIGDYDILAEIGRGGMGVVYKAWHRSLHRPAALKMVLAGEFASPAQELRFRLEAELGARVTHPNIVQVYEIGRYEGRPFLALEWIEGGSLANRLDGTPWPPEEAASLIETLARAIAVAHDEGVVHRDLKPANILLAGNAPGGVARADDAATADRPAQRRFAPGLQPKIADFGLAQTTDSRKTMTHSGFLVGTPGYMAPEQATGKRALVGPATDIYALGVVLYQLLTGQLPFDRESTLELLRAVTLEEPTRPRRLRPRLPRDLEAITLHCLEKEPGRRYPSALALAEDLERFLAGRPIRARQVSFAGRYWRWARRNPGIAWLGGVLTGVLVLATASSLVAMERFRIQAETQSTLATAREVARAAADRARADEAAARDKADQANASLVATHEVLRRTVYATRSNLALAAWTTADVGGLRRLLELLRPAPHEPDLRGWEWRYLWQLGHENRLTLRGTDRDFADVAFSADGKILAGLEPRGRIQLWDRVTGKPLRTMGVTSGGRRAYLGGGVGVVAFSPDGRSLAGPGPNGTLLLYAVDSGLPTLRFEGPADAVLGLAWSPDARTLVASLSIHSMRVWDARDGHLIKRLFGRHAGPVAAVAFSPDGRTIASASFDRTVKLWNPEDPIHPLAILSGHTDEVRAVAFSPDGRRIASAGLDRTLRIWDARSRAQLAVIRGHTGWITSLAYGPEGVKVATGSADETVRLWDTDSGQELRTFKGHTDSVGAVAFSPDGTEIASAGGDASVRVWDAASPPLPRTLHSPSLLTYDGGVECLAFSPDGGRLVSGHDDHALRVWELPSGRLLHVIKGHTDAIKSVAFSPDGRTVASGSIDRTVRLWDTATGQARITFTGHTGEVKGLVFAPDGRTAISSGFDQTIQAWDPATGAVRYVLRGHSGAVGDLAISPEGRTLASASHDTACILWDLASGKPRATLRGHTRRINRVAFSPDGRIVATGSFDRTVRLWDAATGSLQRILEGHNGEIEGLAFSPDGRLASSAGDKTIRLWDPEGGQTVLILKGHAGHVRCIRFSPDGRTLASASEDRTLKLWEAASVAAFNRAPDGNDEDAR